MIRSLIIILLFTGPGLFYTPAGSGYDLAHPFSETILPEELNEISGIAAVDTSLLVCVQDEAGTLFFYDYSKRTIINRLQFGAPGDYEAVTTAGNNIYVLRSDGELFEISGYRTKSFKVKSYKTGIPAKDNEGLCYDMAGNRLLLACKTGFFDDEIKNKQFIFSFDLNTKRLQKEPVIVFDVKLLRKYLKDNKIKINGDDDYGDIDLNTSDIAINPVSGKLHLICADDFLMLTSDLKGNVESVGPLSKTRFRKAEGITFNRYGVMYISNEADGKSATILRYRMVQGN